MLTNQQKKMIELQYEDYALMGEHGFLNGIEYMLEILNENDFKEYLSNKYP